MASRNDITGDAIATKKATDSYRDGWERIFGKKESEKEPPKSECRQCPGCDRKQCEESND